MRNASRSDDDKEDTSDSDLSDVSSSRLSETNDSIELLVDPDEQEYVPSAEATENRDEEEFEPFAAESENRNEELEELLLHKREKAKNRCEPQLKKLQLLHVTAADISNRFGPHQLVSERFLKLLIQILKVTTLESALPIIDKHRKERVEKKGKTRVPRSRDYFPMDLQYALEEIQSRKRKQDDVDALEPPRRPKKPFIPRRRMDIMKEIAEREREITERRNRHPDRSMRLVSS